MGSKQIKQEVKKKLHKRVMLGVFICIGLLCLFICYFVFMDMHNVSDDFLIRRNDMQSKEYSSKLNFAKAYNVQKQKQEQVNRDEEKHFGSLGSITVGTTIAGMPLEYFCFFPVYEAGSDMFDINQGDGGFGPIQETHSGLANTVDGMYLIDSDYWAGLKPFVDNPTSYLASCPGNHVKDHKWGPCKSHASGSALLKAYFESMTATPEGAYKFYNDYVQAESVRYFETAVSDVKTNLGESYLKPGTVGLVAAYYVRRDVYGTVRQDIWLGITPGMNEEEAIARIMKNCENREPANEKFRWICCGEIVRNFNNGTADILKPITCDGSCGSLHGGGYSFGKLFFGRD